MKNFFFVFLFFLFSLIKSEAQAKVTSTNYIDLFENKLKILSKHSYNEGNSINWSSEFIFISKNEDTLKYQLENQSYKIIRHVTLKNSKINIIDKYINKLDKTIGIISEYKFQTLQKNKYIYSGIELNKKNKNFNIIGENPSIIFQSKNTSFGFYLKDLYSKINTKIIKKNDNNLILKNDNLIIKARQTYTKNFEIYFFKKKLTYYDYMNFLRNKLNSFSNIDGNFFFIDTYRNREILLNKKKLKSFIKNYNVKFILTTPWLDYSDFNFGTNKRYTRNEVKKHLVEIKEIIKSIDPEIKLLAPIQSNVISLNYETQDFIKSQNKISDGFNFYKVNLDEFMNKSNLNINKNELIFDKQNRVLFETYFHDWKYENKRNIPEIALALKGYNEGYLLNKLKDQINFVIDEVNYDGIYIDQFNQYFISPKHRFSHNSQNNNIGEIDTRSGKIINEYENVTLNTLGFEDRLIDYALKKTSYLVVNSHHLHDKLRGKKIIRFAEGFWYFWVDKMWKDGSKKLYTANTFLRSHLSTPVALSLGTIQPGDWQINPHDALVKNLRFCLFNGNLMYFLEQDIDKLNLNTSKLNVFQKIYPIKIVKIDQGIIFGENKILTIKSYKIKSKELKKYNIFIFDKSGYIIDQNNKRLNFNNEFTKININEEEEILILEKK